MARVIAKDTALYVRANGASRAFSGRANTVTMNFTSAGVDVSAFGDNWRNRVPGGLKDWSLECGGWWDGAASQIDVWLYSILAACVDVQYGPGGSTSGNVKYSGCMILDTYTVSGELEGATAWEATFSAASTLNRGTW